MYFVFCLILVGCLTLFGVQRVGVLILLLQLRVVLRSVVRRIVWMWRCLLRILLFVGRLLVSARMATNRAVSLIFQSPFFTQYLTNPFMVSILCLYKNQMTKKSNWRGRCPSVCFAIPTFPLVTCQLFVPSVKAFHFSFSNVLSFRTIKIEIFPFCTNILTALRTFTIDMTLSSLSKVTSVRIFSINVPLFYQKPDNFMWSTHSHKPLFLEKPDQFT